MKKITLSILAVALVLSSGTIVYAQDTSSGPRPGVNMTDTRQLIKNNLEERKDVRASTTQTIKAIRVETKEEIKQKIEQRNRDLKELREKLASSTKERRDQKQESLRRVAEARIKKMIEKMQATIDRESRIMAKIVSRIEKFKLAGAKTDEAEKHVAQAKAHIAEAQTTLDSIKSNSDTFVTVIDQGSNASTTASQISKIKNIVNDVEKYLKLGHKSLIEAVTSLKGMSSARPNATSTQPTN